MKKGDKFVLCLVIIVFLFSLGSIVFYFISGKDQKVIAEVYKEGKVIYKIDLATVNKPKEFKVKVGKEEFNSILIEKGRIRFNDATCHDKVCVRSGWLSKKGEMAVCLPHKIYIKIIGEKVEVDEVTF